MLRHPFLLPAIRDLVCRLDRPGYRCTQPRLREAALSARARACSPRLSAAIPGDKGDASPAMGRGYAEESEHVRLYFQAYAKAFGDIRLNALRQTEQLLPRRVAMVDQHQGL